jgi:hypothetical protein
MGSPHGLGFYSKLAYHVLNPFFSSFLVQLAETKYYRLEADRLNDQVAESNEVQAEASSMPVD